MSTRLHIFYDNIDSYTITTNLNMMCLYIRVRSLCTNAYGTARENASVCQNEGECPLPNAFVFLCRVLLGGGTLKQNADHACSA